LKTTQFNRFYRNSLTSILLWGIVGYWYLALLDELLEPRSGFWLRFSAHCARLFGCAAGRIAVGSQPSQTFST